MRRHFRWDRKYLYWGITAFCVIAAAILFYMALRFLPDLRRALGKLLKILSPFIWGFVITYLIAPLMRLLERSVFGPLCRKLFAKNKKSDGSKLARGLAVLISELAMVAVLTALVYLILPQLYSSIETIVKNGPDYLRDLSAWVTGLHEGEHGTASACTLCSAVPKHLLSGIQALCVSQSCPTLQPHGL